MAASGCITSGEFTKYTELVDVRLKRVAADVGQIDGALGADIARQGEALGADTAKLVAEVEERISAQVSAAGDLLNLMKGNPATTITGIAGLVLGAMKTTNVVRDRARRRRKEPWGAGDGVQPVAPAPPTPS